MKAPIFLIASGLAALLTSPGLAEDHEVQMLNKDSEGRPMQFEPAFLRIAPGDTVTFVATDKGHNSESILTLTPKDAELWKGKIGQEVSVTFDVEGFYAYKCLPHIGLGMVGLIQVGEPSVALDSVEVGKLPQRAEDRLNELIAEAVGGAEAPNDATTPAAQ